jgi:Type ISP C-terminal specificity domain/N-6 DNA Methylase
MEGPAAQAGSRFPGDPERPNDFADRLSEAVAEFGATVRQPLAAGLGRAEDQIAAPVARLVRAIGEALRLDVVTHAETPLSELSVRPDFAVDVADGAVGFIEVKRPGKGANPASWSARSHDGRQWQKLRLLPNVLYTDGNDWALYRDGERVGRVARVAGALDRAGRSLRPADDNLARVIEEFLWRPPAPPRNLRSLVRTVARLCRYLREEVIEVLEYERAARGGRPFTALAQEWRELMFPRMTENARFADAYAQTITFALLLARNAGIAFEGRDLPAIGRQLGKQYALIGRALAILSDPAAADSLLVIETLRRIIGAVDWDQLDTASAEAHATLYETFLQEYDPALRRLSGSYYTPDRLARSMVRFTDEVLREKLNRPWGYANDDVIVVDPAMGTGTFLVEVIDVAAKTVAAHQGEGARAQRLRDLFRDRLIGFERQVTPYAVAEMRLHEALKTRYGVDVPEQEMRFLADTFEDPDKQELVFGSMYAELQRQREGANRVKRDVPVMAVIGNPPYLDRAHQRDPAPWIEDRREEGKPVDIAHRPSLDEFRRHDRLDYKLAATWVFYWRWAVWKAFEAHPEHPAGVVAFITPSSYLTGAAFAKMRSYLRRVADEAWIIDVSPEGHQPPVTTRLFPSVQQPLCIAVFARYGRSDANVSARAHYRAVPGTCEEKLRVLDHLHMADPGWQNCLTGNEDPFMPTGTTDWHHYPPLADIFPWQSPGVKANRTWVVAPDPGVLQDRWEMLTGSSPSQRDTLLKTTRDRTADSLTMPIPGRPQPPRSLRAEASRQPHIVPYAYRSFDRQYLILDTRVIDRPRPDLWSAEGPRQVFINEPHTSVINDGPGLTFAATAPDMHYFQGHHGGRVLPLFRDAAGTLPNIAPGLLRYLQQSLHRDVNAEDLLAYIAAVVAHPGYTRRFREELTIPGIRIPLTAEEQVWNQAISLGRRVIFLHTFATRYPGPTPHHLTAPQPPEYDSPRIVHPIPYSAEEMPDTVQYDAQTQTLRIGRTGQVAPVSAAVWGYSVGGMRVADKWIGYRLKNPRGRAASSPLDEIHANNWTRFFNDDLLNLLHVLGWLVRLERAQSNLLDEVCSRRMIGVAQLREAGVLPVAASARHQRRQLGTADQMAI